jgi:hypothetical protein
MLYSLLAITLQIHLMHDVYGALDSQLLQWLSLSCNKIRHSNKQVYMKILFNSHEIIFRDHQSPQFFTIVLYTLSCYKLGNETKLQVMK